MRLPLGVRGGAFAEVENERNDELLEFGNMNFQPE
jgi:hypothetical protein